MPDESVLHTVYDWGWLGVAVVLSLVVTYLYRDWGKKEMNLVDAHSAHVDKIKAEHEKELDRVRLERDAALAKIDTLRQQQIDREKESSDRRTSLQADIERLREELRKKE